MFALYTLILISDIKLHQRIFKILSVRTEELFTIIIMSINFANRIKSAPKLANSFGRIIKLKGFGKCIKKQSRFVPRYCEGCNSFLAVVKNNYNERKMSVLTLGFSYIVWIGI